MKTRMMIILIFIRILTWSTSSRCGKTDVAHTEWVRNLTQC